MAAVSRRALEFPGRLPHRAAAPEKCWPANQPAHNVGTPLPGKNRAENSAVRRRRQEQRQFHRSRHVAKAGVDGSRRKENSDGPPSWRHRNAISQLGTHDKIIGIGKYFTSIRTNRKVANSTDHSNRYQRNMRWNTRVNGLPARQGPNEESKFRQGNILHEGSHRSVPEMT